MPGHDIIVLGGSAGALEGLRQIAAGVPGDPPPPVFVGLHQVAYAPRPLPGGPAPAGPPPAPRPADPEEFRPGTLCVAPPDHHLLVGAGFVQVVQGPREHNARPGIDPLFRTAAVSHGPRVVGVLLSGLLDDGTAGLAAVKSQGGVAVVQ